MPAALPPLPTSIVGSLPQPGWLIDRDRPGPPVPAAGPRARAVAGGPGGPGGGPGRRHSPRRPGAGAGRAGHRDRRRDAPGVLLEPLRHRAEGIDLDSPGSVTNRSGIGRSRCRASSATSAAREPIQARDVRFLRAQTDRTIKITVPGRSRWPSRRRTTTTATTAALALAYADVVRAEIADLFAAGADIVQIDEPWLQARPEMARRYGVEVLTRALEGAAGAACAAPVLRLRRDGRRAARGVLVPPRAGRHPGRHDLGRDRAVAPRPRHAAAAARQGHRARRPRPLDPGDRDAGGGRRPGAPGAGRRRRRPAACSPATAG